MQVIVNNEPVTVPDGATIAELIERLGLAKAACAAEVNTRLVPKREHVSHVLSERDRVELVTLVGGG